MTNELEKQFFDTFGIEPEIFTGCKLEKNNWKEDTCPFEKDGIMELCHKVCKYAFTEREIYPQITDRILLELICIHNTYLETNLYSLEYKSLKKEILKDLINEQESREFKKDYISDNMKHQIRTLFEEG